MFSGLFNNTIGRILPWRQDLSTDSSQMNSQNVLPKGRSRENVTILSPQTNLQFDRTQVQSVLSDFEKLDFKDNNCFDKIADDYRKKDISLFNYVILNKRKEIIDILGRNLPLENQEEFRRKYGQYILLNINITKPGQSLETSRLFTEKTKRMEEEKSEVKRAKIYSNSKRIVTIEKNEKQQRNYFFEKCAICDIEISWGAKDESGKDLNCAVVFNVNSGQISIKNSTIDGKDVESKEILELAKQNEAVLMKGKALHEVLCMTKQTPCEGKRSAQSRESITVPSSSLDGGTTIEEGVPVSQKKTAAMSATH